jgi:hypothetical protein
MRHKPEVGDIYKIDGYENYLILAIDAETEGEPPSATVMWISGGNAGTISENFAIFKRDERVA